MRTWSMFMCYKIEVIININSLRRCRKITHPIKMPEYCALVSQRKVDVSDILHMEMLMNF